jgi:hypothetical protein
MINLAAGAKLTGYDIRLATARVYRVRGILLGSDGKPQKAGAVRLTSESDAPYVVNINSGMAPKKGSRNDPLSTGPLGFFTLIQNPALLTPTAPITKTAEDGTFEFQSVARRHHLFVAALDALPGPFASASAASVVVDRDIDDLRIQFEPPTSIDALAEIAGNDRAPDPNVISMASINLGGRITFAQSDGSIHINDLTPGTYRISATPGLPGGHYLSGITLGGRDVLGQPVTLGPGVPPIHLIYKAGGATVHGTLGSGQAAVMIPVDSLDPQAQHSGRLMNLAGSKEFEMRSLAPGSYYAFAVETMIPGMLFDLQSIARIRAGAVLVKVAEGNTLTEAFPLVELG